MTSGAKNPEAQQFAKTFILVTDVAHKAVASGHIKTEIFSISTSSSASVSSILNYMKGGVPKSLSLRTAAEPFWGH